MVIDLELAGRTDTPVFWPSDTLPRDVKAGRRAFGVLDDLWQLGKMILKVELGGPQEDVRKGVYAMARQLVARRMASATAALSSLSDL